MSTKDAKLHDSERPRLTRSRWHAAALRGPLPGRWLAAAAVAVALLMLQSPAAHPGPCLPSSQPLLKIPELVRDDQTKVLRGTMLLTDEQRGLIFRSPALPGQGATQAGQP